MGFSGRVVLARGYAWAAGGSVSGADVLDRTEFAGGWTAVTFDGDPRLPLARLVAATAAPALSAFVMDSDCADVTAATPAGLSWHAYLHEDMALSYGAPTLAGSADDVLDLAMAWAIEAGRTPDRNALAAALATNEVFVEDTLDSLFAALGFVGAQ